ncbi:hypothetical protein [Liquorilactobacillus capillatus]|uniref:glutamate--cysteine ligase n=1 Tax=Liquorilactobacillus capillatus DSM 19910 TaxID=1423731 RepID=A0A0R1M312_9LACO|nr:hypothetical protein [Liquorilactobacillus capillatus]KRL00100.1 bifunctional glutamate--cysteine ligase glutathione synthetase [Liquorilactobacillus capillatus DSM 19910]
MVELDEIGKQIAKDNLFTAVAAIRWQVQRTWKIQSVNPTIKTNVQSVAAIKPSTYFRYNAEQQSVSLLADHWSSKKDQQQMMVLNQQLLQENLGDKSVLWPLSVVSEDKKSVVGGVTVRLQLPEELFLELYKNRFKQLQIDYITFRNQIYMKVLQQFVNYRWLLTYLTGATPFVAGSNIRPVRSQSECCLAASVDAVKRVDYRSLQSYLRSSQHQQAGLTDGIKVGSSFENEHEMLQKGIHYLEITHLDLNPFAAMGVSFEMLDLIEALVAFFLVTPGIKNDDLQAALQEKRQLNQHVAHENPFSATTCQLQARKIINQLSRFTKEIGRSDLGQSLSQVAGVLKQPTETPSTKLLRKQDSQKLTESTLKLVADYAVKGRLTQAKTTLDDNSRLVLSAAFKLGVPYAVISAPDHLIRVGKSLLERGIQTEKTSAVMQKIWKNRQLSQKIVAAAGYAVPTGWTITQTSEILNVYRETKGLALVIKNNYRTGAQVFRIPPTQDIFVQTVKQYLSSEQPCLIEQVVLGSSYTALLVGGKVVSLIERLPQNIVGDGRSTIKQLIQRKQVKQQNRQTQFAFGEVQARSLAEQGRVLEDILPRGVQLYLRYDASTNTGADYLEVSSEIDSSYLKKIAELARTLQMSDGSLDIMITNIYQPLTAANEKSQLVFLNAHAFPALRKHYFTLLRQTQAVAESIVKNATREK